MNNLREKRRSKNMSQWSLAQSSKVHQSRISLIENDLVGPSEDEKDKLSGALGVRVSELFGDAQIPIGTKGENQK